MNATLDTGLICACPRDWQELRRREEVARGRVRAVYQYQCTRCGRGHGIWAREPIARELPAWDYSLPLADEVELEVPEVAAWWPRYDEYLRSPEWASKRQRALASWPCASRGSRSGPIASRRTHRAGHHRVHP
jgi:hypothetical protein